MPRDGRRGKLQANKRKTNMYKPPRKLQRKDRANSHGKEAVNEDYKAAPQDEKPHNYKPDHVLLGIYPNAAIYEDYACVLIKTNTGNKNSKFYIIQVVKVKKKYICFTRWGYVGEEGQFNFVIQKTDEGAIKVFKMTFKEKTKNDWDQRENFTPQPGMYTFTEIGEDDEDDAGDHLDKECTPCSVPCPLPYRTQIMIQLIYSDDMFLEAMLYLHLDLRKVSLDKLNELNFAEGIAILKDIEEAVAHNKPQKLQMDLTTKFYSLFPITYTGICPPVIDTQKKMQMKREVLTTLVDIVFTQNLQHHQICRGSNKILEMYEILDCNLTLLENDSQEFKIIRQYSTASTRGEVGKLLDVWRVDRQCEIERFAVHTNIKNRKLLWHGTSVAVVAAILKAGLKILPHSGGHVGEGIYFASQFNKSLLYVKPYHGTFADEDMVGFVFLVEVALGREKYLTEHCAHMTRAPVGYDSVVAKGIKEPDPKKNIKMNFDGKQVVVPLGKSLYQTQWSHSVYEYSEYIVYEESQTRIRYMIKFSFS